MKRIASVVVSFFMMIMTVQAWEPPIGIPRPEFGIEETYRMYDDPANRNPALPYTQNAEGGYYTHYIDNTHPSATDTSNPYGTASRPRFTIPRSVAAGSVVEIHGGPYNSDPRWNGIGTQEKPIFYRGYDVENKPRISVTSTIGFYGHLDAEYIIFENMHFYQVPVVAYSETHHIAIRNSEVEGSLGQAHTAGIQIYTPTSALPEATLHDIVIYNNEIHHVGDWQASGDPDGQGLTVTGRHTHNVWIVDNLFHHNSGCGAMAIGGFEAIHHIYMGRNRGYQNKQDLLWTKEATDIIFSENVAWDHRPSDSSLGGGMGLQYGPMRVWFLFNEIYNCTFGIRMSTDNGAGGMGPGNDTYIIGNLIHDIHRESGEGGPHVWKGGAGIFIASEVSERGIFFNTIYNADAGILIARRAKVKINNNIFSNIGEEHIFLEYPDSLLDCDIENNIFDIPARIIWGRTGDSTTYSLSSFNSAYPGKADGSIEADPLFVDAENQDFHLQSMSPAIDQGTSSGVVQEVFDRFEQLYGIDIRKDIEGRTRPQGSAWDIGAYEYILFPVSVIQNEPKEGRVPLTVSFDGSQSSSPNGDIVSYEWDFGDGSTSTGIKTSHIFTSAGEYTVTLTVTDDHGWKGKSQTRITVFEKEFGALPGGCYNNVFNPTKGEKALIVVELPKQAHVRLNLYNTRGKRIKELADEEKEAGTHKYYWDGKSSNGDVVGSGLYFVHIQAGDYKKTKKIVVVK